MAHGLRTIAARSISTDHMGATFLRLAYRRCRRLAWSRLIWSVFFESATYGLEVMRGSTSARD
jgi:hypothetical protein